MSKLKSGNQPGRGVMSDEYMLYTYKVIPCSRVSTHNWKLCQFSHVGEVAARRRHPSMHQADLCAYISANKQCPMGDSCPYAHNAFESWLHPDRYKTTMCSYAGACTRKFCFFAHSAAELRTPSKQQQQQQQQGASRQPQQVRLAKTVSLETNASVGTPNSSMSHGSSSSVVQVQGLKLPNWSGSPAALGPASPGSNSSSLMSLSSLNSCTAHSINLFSLTPGGGGSNSSSSSPTSSSRHNTFGCYAQGMQPQQQSQQQQQQQQHRLATSVAAAGVGLAAPPAALFPGFIVSGGPVQPWAATGAPSADEMAAAVHLEQQQQQQSWAFSALHPALAAAGPAVMAVDDLTLQAENQLALQKLQLMMQQQQQQVAWTPQQQLAAILNDLQAPQTAGLAAAAAANGTAATQLPAMQVVTAGQQQLQLSACQGWGFLPPQAQQQQQQASFAWAAGTTGSTAGGSSELLGGFALQLAPAAQQQQQQQLDLLSFGISTA